MIPVPRGTISCPNRDFLQRKWDDTCERCCVENEQSKRRTNAYLFRIGFPVLVALGFYAYVNCVIPGISE